MKARYRYLLMFAVPSAIAAFLTVFAVAGVGYGVLWLFVYGDNEWPEFAERLVLVTAVSIATAVFLMLCLASYAFGKRQEGAAPRFGRHAAIGAGISLLLIALALLHQFRVGNLGPAPDSVVCVEFCTEHGFESSNVPGDRTCRCLDAAGEAAMNVELDRLRARDP